MNLSLLQEQQGLSPLNDHSIPKEKQLTIDKH